MKLILGDRLFFYLVKLWIWTVLVFGPLFSLLIEFQNESSVQTNFLFFYIWLGVIGMLYSLPVFAILSVSIIFIKRIKFSLGKLKIILSVLAVFFTTIYLYIHNDGRELPSFGWTYLFAISSSTIAIIFIDKVKS